VKHCIRCCYPSTKPNLWFDDTGLCSACIYYDNQSKIDWSVRAQEFSIKCPPGMRVVVACSGGKDSTYLVVRCKELGLHPIAVCATTDHLSDIGRRNLDNIGRLCDLIEVTTDKTLRRKMARYALETVGDISWCEHQTIWSIPARVAKGLDIPYVLYGENPQNAYGAGPPDSAAAATMGQRWEAEFGGLNGLRLGDMKEQFPDGDFELYRMPVNPPERVFFGHFFEWDGYQNAVVAKMNGMEFYSRWVEGSACAWENLDNAQTGAHDHLRWLKFGYGRATDIVSSQIRRGKMSREHAIEIVKERDGMFPWTYLGVPLEEILSPLGLSQTDFLSICRRFTNRTLFDDDGTPTFEVT
jgi:N-acetyl sugar amidotransferase